MKLRINKILMIALLLSITASAVAIAAKSIATTSPSKELTFVVNPILAKGLHKNTVDSNGLNLRNINRSDFNNSDFANNDAMNLAANRYPQRLTTLSPIPEK